MKMYTYFYFASLLVAACKGQAQPDNTLEQVPVDPSGPSQVCTKRNGYFEKDGSCDSYVECRNYRAKTLSCPEGLNYNPSAKWPEYPCGYPIDVPCLNGGVSQVAKSTAECLHQYGFYPSLKVTPDRCGDYRMCVEGRSIDMSCPIGLAFNSVTGRCDWPDQVPSCKVDDFLGFKCPVPPLGADGQPLDIILNYKYDGECLYFFSCDKGRARLLSCDNGFLFDPVTAKCVDADLVQCNVQPIPSDQQID